MWYVVASPPFWLEAFAVDGRVRRLIHADLARDGSATLVLHPVSTD
jgi:hypothetical protein